MRKVTTGSSVTTFLIVSEQWSRCWYFRRIIWYPAKPGGNQSLEVYAVVKSGERFSKVPITIPFLVRSYVGVSTFSDEWTFLGNKLSSCEREWPFARCEPSLAELGLSKRHKLPNAFWVPRFTSFRLCPSQTRNFSSSEQRSLASEKSEQMRFWVLANTRCYAWCAQDDNLWRTDTYGVSGLSDYISY